MVDLCLPWVQLRTRSSCIRCSWSWRPWKKQIRDLVEKQAQLRERRATLETSRADAHKSGVSIQRAANTPTTDTPLCFSDTGPVHPGRDLPRCPSLRRRDTTDPGCNSSRRRKPGPGRQPLPLRRLRSSRSPPETAPLLSVRRNATLWSAETPSFGMSVLC